MSLSTQGSLDEISNEDIKHLVFRSEPEEIKFPMYRSKFSVLVKEEMKKGRDCHRTMGYAHGFNTNCPDQFLKKKSRKVYIAHVEKPERSTGLKSVPIPKRGDWNGPPARVEQNYLINNIRNVVRAVPPTGPSRPFDSTLGKKVHNCNLLIPVFTMPEALGKVPQYINRVKRELEIECGRQSLVNMKKAGQNEEKVKVLPQKDREELLQSLKNVWNELQREFQVLPVLNDTPPKVKRKQLLEARLVEIEKDIKLVEENEKIYIIQDPDDPRCAATSASAAC